MVISTYLFRKLLNYSIKTWEGVIERLTSSLEKTSHIGPTVKTVYLLVNEATNAAFISRKSNKSKKDVLIRIKQIIHNRKKCVGRRKKASKSMKCVECNERFPSQYLLSRHNVKVHNKTGYSCSQCARMFASTIQLEYHAERVHYPKKLQCPKCDKIFSTEKVLKHHDKYHHMAAICKLCFLQFPSKKALRSHLDKHDLNTCPRCDKTLSNKHTFKTHLQQCGNLEDKTPKFFCDICSRGYVRKNGLRSHLKTDHGFGNVLTCKWCGKKFDAVSKLKNHIVKHTKEKNFHCEHCGNRFVTKAALTYHVRLHTGERPFPCDMCEETFLSASRRMEHKRRKHLGPTKECPVCPMKFPTSSQLKKHVERHNNPQSKLYCPDTNESQQLAINAIMVI